MQENTENVTPVTPLNRRWTVLWREWLKPFLTVAIVMGTFRSAVADWNLVPTGSMRPTILEGDRIFVNKLAYGLRVPFAGWRIVDWDDPKRGDVVVFDSPADGIRLVKRVVGLPGDRIEARDGQLSINDQPAVYEPLDANVVNQIKPAEQDEHSFAAEQIGGAQTHPVMRTPGRGAPRDFGPIMVPAGHYFMMGDNRDNSRDSRSIGFVSRDLIMGRASRVVISLDPDDGYLPRWQRLLRPLD